MCSRPYRMLVVISFLRVAGRAYTMSHPGCSCEPEEASFLMARMQSSFFFAFQSLTAARDPLCCNWESLRAPRRRKNLKNEYKNFNLCIWLGVTWLKKNKKKTDCVFGGSLHRGSSVRLSVTWRHFQNTPANYDNPALRHSREMLSWASRPTGWICNKTFTQHEQVLFE